MQHGSEKITFMIHFVESVECVLLLYTICFFWSVPALIRSFRFHVITLSPSEASSLQQVLEVGTGPSGKRVKVHAASGEEGSECLSLSPPVGSPLSLLFLLIFLFLRKLLNLSVAVVQYVLGLFLNFDFWSSKTPSFSTDASRNSSAQICPCPSQDGPASSPPTQRPCSAARSAPSRWRRLRSPSQRPPKRRQWSQQPRLQWSRWQAHQAPQWPWRKFRLSHQGVVFFKLDAFELL